MAKKREEMNGSAMDNTSKSAEFENGTVNQSEKEVVVLDSEGSESHVDGGEDGTAKTGEAAIGSSSSSCVFRPIPAFLQKLYDILGNDEFNSVVSWSCSGTSFVVKNSHLFAANVLPMYFKHNNFQSFISQLNSYGFKKISWEQWEYKNEYFRKGERNLLKNIKRKDHCLKRNQPSSNVKTCVCTSSCSSNMEKELTFLMKEHRRVKAEIMKLREKQHSFEEKIASLENQAMSNKENRKRMMLVVQRVLNKQRDPSNDEVASPEENREREKKKGKRKLEMGSATTQDKGKVVLDEEEMAKHQSNTFFSLEDLFGESYWIEHVKELQEKANNLKS